MEYVWYVSCIFLVTFSTSGDGLTGLRFDLPVAMDSLGRGTETPREAARGRERAKEREVPF